MRLTVTEKGRSESFVPNHRPTIEIGEQKTLSNLEKLIRNPTRYLPLLLRSTLQPLCHVFKNSAFFMQGQMDISPRARWHNPSFTALTGGFYPPNDATKREIRYASPYDSTRRDMLVLLLRTIVTNEIPGSFAELGVYKGHTASLFHHYAPERQLHLFDTFNGFTERSISQETQHTGVSYRATEFSDTSLDAVKQYINSVNNNIHYHQGFFPDSIPLSLAGESFAFVHLDADLYEPTRGGLEFFYSRMAKRGIIVVHDYNSWPGARSAVDEFFADKAETPIPMPDKSGSALIIKQ